MPDCIVLEAFLPTSHILLHELLARQLALVELLADLVPLLVHLVRLLRNCIGQFVRIVALLVSLYLLEQFLKFSTLSIVYCVELIVLLHRFGENFELQCLLLG